jgi:hypothetical protein
MGALSPPVEEQDMPDSKNRNKNEKPASERDRDRVEEKKLEKVRGGTAQDLTQARGGPGGDAKQPLPSGSGIN